MTALAPKRPRGRPRKNPADAEPGTVQALDRGLQLLSVLSKEHRVSLSALAQTAGMPASTVHRLLTTLQRHRFAEFDEAAQEWMIGVEAFRVGAGFTKRINLVEASRDIMQRLMHKTGETANLAIADDGEVVFISQMETHQPIRAFFRLGTRSAMHASGAGKVLLAQLSDDALNTLVRRKGLPRFTPKTLTRFEDLAADLAACRTRGWSFDDEERYAGMCCIAAPVFNARGAAVAGISVSGPTVRFGAAALPALSAAVCQAAAELSENIGAAADEILGPMV
ncbi:MAG: HTH-type transcriptional regulator BhcR [Pseudomonadota bacterium]